jgi:hypothetical protein
MKCADDDTEDEAGAATSSSRTSYRSWSSTFNIRRDCFICSKDSIRPEVLTPISTGTGKTTREKVLAAAEERLDDVIHMRMVNHPDLFAFDAKYHRSCYSHYISERNIAAARKKSSTERSTDMFDQAFNDLTKQIDHMLLKSTKSAVTLKYLHKVFIDKLEQYGAESAGSYSSWKLKSKLQLHYGDSLAFLEQPGKSDLVCSATLSVIQAMKAAASLYKEDEEEDILSEVGSEEMDEAHILHRAAGIMRKHMSEVKMDRVSYVNSEQLSLDHCSAFVPDLLYDFINWTIDEKAYTDVRRCNKEDAGKDNLGVISICHSLIAQKSRLPTPVTLGLAAVIHHEYGSRMLIEQLHSLGFCISYDELRRFLTSIAADQISRSKDIYIPHGITHVQDHGMVDAAIDNFDQNEDTLDGRSTTHALAAVLFKRGNSQQQDSSNIPRVKERALADVPSYDPDSDVLQRYQ